jgi:acyl-CoA dehydrogenase
VLDGSKRYITNAPVADVFTVFASTDPAQRGRGLSVFVLEAGAPGLEVGPPTEMCGGRGSLHAPLAFRGCRVPAADRVGEEGEGFAIAMRCLDAGRTHWAAYAVGAAQRLLELAVAHLKTRRQFGRPLAENQGLQWMLAEHATALHAARLVCYDAAVAYDREPERRRAAAARAKLHCTETACRAADAVLQMFGGAGYARELPIERIWRELRVARILDGTSEVLKGLIARDLLA